ncbi:hypothetical protein GOODEAATRI_002284 [Goodea atripinnis]|uniref:Uncharacterized protein n=1 Tax=Goodea atripinnis TaxID=208336 RepID=A0ABV0N8B4_9TELE
MFLAGISFIPREVGEHQVSILKNGRHVANSPITIMVVQSEIGDARRVKAHGEGLVQATTFSNASFVVDTQEAGQFRDQISEDINIMTLHLKHVIRVCGQVMVAWLLRVTGEGRIRESITRRQKAASVASVGSVCDLNLKIPASWFLLVLSQQHLSRSSFCSHISLWWCGRSRGRVGCSSAAAQDQSFSPSRVRLISGLSGLVLPGATRGVWVIDAFRPAGSAGMEGAL